MVQDGTPLEVYEQSSTVYISIRSSTIGITVTRSSVNESKVPRPSSPLTVAETSAYRKKFNAPSSTLSNTFESGLKAIAATFLRFSKAKVCDLLLLKVNTIRTRPNGTTHLTRSKTETLFPTGLRTEFPSGVKTMFPCL